MGKTKRFNPLDVPTGHSEWRRRKQGAFAVRKKRKETRASRRNPRNEGFSFA